MFGAMAMAVALGVHRRRFTSATRNGVWGTLAGCIILVIVQSLVVTRREALIETVQQLTAAVDEGNVLAMEPFFYSEVRLGQKGAAPREAILRMADLALREYQVDEAGTGGFNMEIAGDRATVTFRVTCDLQGRDVGYRTPSTWRLGVLYDANQWRIDHIESGEIGLGGIGQSIDVMPYLQSQLASARQSPN